METKSYTYSTISHVFLHDNLFGLFINELSISSLDKLLITNKFTANNNELKILINEKKALKTAYDIYSLFFMKNFNKKNLNGIEDNKNIIDYHYAKMKLSRYILDELTKNKIKEIALELNELSEVDYESKKQYKLSCIISRQMIRYIS